MNEQTALQQMLLCGYIHDAVRIINGRTPEERLACHQRDASFESEETLFEWLTNAFNWEETPQGRIFWFRVRCFVHQWEQRQKQQK